MFLMTNHKIKDQTMNKFDNVLKVIRESKKEHDESSKSNFYLKDGLDFELWFNHDGKVKTKNRKFKGK